MKETADKVAMDEAIKKLTKRYESIRKSWQQTDDDELLERYLSAMTTVFDPHSSYMAPSTLDNFNIQMKLELDGIGASLRAIDGYTVVQNIIPGGAADKNGGIKPEDKIVGVGEGSSGPMEDIVDMKLNDVVKKIRGKRGTHRPARSRTGRQCRPQDDRHHPRPHRAEGQRSSQRDHRARQEGRRHAVSNRRHPAAQLLHGHGRRPHWACTDFKSTTRDVRRLLEEFKAKNVDAVVVDLRWNGGGSLTEAVNMTGLFIDNGPVVQVKGPDGRTSAVQGS